MSPPALLIDFGSTFTKVTAVDLVDGRALGRAESPSTVDTDVCEGLAKALDSLAARGVLQATGKRGLDLLVGAFVRASSSAAGGLRIVVVGNVPGLTVEAGNTAALGAGAKVIGAFGFKLGAGGVADIERMQPDLVLLTGGTDGGDASTILHNARSLADSRLAAPVVVAGNAMAAGEAASALIAAGKSARIAANVMPSLSCVSANAAQAAIREIFMDRITRAKGFERLAGIVPIVLATPMAVHKAACLAALGHGSQPGWGDLVLVDIGGATTDVHSIGEGGAASVDMLARGLVEPTEKRTVEGDLGMRVNAATIVARAGPDRFYALFQTLFPSMRTSRGDLVDYAEAVSEEPSRTPNHTWEVAADATLARQAAEIAIDRHAGRREPYYASSGRIWLQHGKDLTEVPTMIGTGGVFVHNRFADRILAQRADQPREATILRPREPQIMLDRDYMLYASGLLAEEHPRIAMRLLERTLVGANGMQAVSRRVAVGHSSPHDHEDCCG